MTHKYCKQCDSTLPIDNFGREHGGYSSRCKFCRNANDRLKRSKDNSRDRKWHLHNKYKMSIEEYTNKLEEQNYLCAICLNPEIQNINLAVDHNHRTGQIRGLLCSKCNIALGHFFDEPGFIQRAYRYLEKYEDLYRRIEDELARFCASI